MFSVHYQTYQVDIEKMPKTMRHVYEKDVMSTCWICIVLERGETERERADVINISPVHVEMELE